MHQSLVVDGIDGSPPVTALTALLAEGQSVWLDTLSRSLVRSGALKELVARGVRGVTSNPTIFAAALGAPGGSASGGRGGADGSAYDDDIRRMVARGLDAAAVFEALEVRDITDACDVLLPIYERTGGADGFASIEVSPACAHDTAATVDEGRRLWRRVARENAMVKVPGTKEGWPAIETLLREGVNVNITLLFSRDHHDRVIEAYLTALEARVADGLPIDRLASVASFFVSRVDSAVDALLDDKHAHLRGKAGISNAQLAWSRFRDRFAGPRFAPLKSRGARVQRPLWASTGTKNPDYRDVMYVEALIGPDTVNTLPQKTLDAFVDHGVVRRTVDAGLDTARRNLNELAGVGIDLPAVTQRLEDDGVASFTRSWADLLDAVRVRAVS